MNTVRTKPLWTFPWGYAESILIVFAVFVACLGLDLSIGPAPSLRFPVNIALGTILLAVIALSFGMRTKSQVVAWIVSVQAAIASIVLFVAVSVLMATIPQHDLSPNPLRTILGSWMYFGAYAFMLITLGHATLKRVWPFQLKNCTYLLNHLGLFIALMAAGLGAGDMQKLTMQIEEGTPVWYATDLAAEPVELPFAIELTRFSIDEYLPKLVLVTGQNEIVEHKGFDQVADMDTSSAMAIADHQIRIVDFYPSAQYFGDTYRPVNDFGSAPAAKLIIDNADTALWVSCGSFMCSPSFVRLNDSLFLKMAAPEPKRFYSKIKIFTKESERPYMDIIEVNKPLKLGDWKIYQVSYDQTKGKWSRTSILELVRDPWLPYVYTGLFMMVSGAVLLGFQHKKKTSHS